MHYEQIDLNLLSIFEAVMTELNVSRAAERLNMTQPAVSHALRRLRRITNDELFLKVPSGVSPTPKALELWAPISEGLLQIRQALSPTVFDFLQMMWHERKQREPAHEWLRGVIIEITNSL